MEKMYFDTLELIGKTPLLRLEKTERELGLFGKIWAKAEFLNPGGSVKDRVARFLVSEAEKSGELRPGGRIIEATSGNTGIALAMIGAVKGYFVSIYMPENMSGERVKIMCALGAEVVRTPATEGMAGAVKRAEERAREEGNSFLPRQFENPKNPLAHRLTTAPEIYSALGGEVDIFVCGVGTGGTISGVGEYLKEKKSGVKIVAIEPKESAVLSGFSPHVHGISGIGAGFVPKILNKNIIDEIICVSTSDAYRCVREGASREGLLSGISSGAALCGAIALAGRRENAGKNIVTILPDRAERYFSAGLFE